MRWLFALLLLANVGVWMWGQWYQGGVAKVAPRAQVNADNIRLLSEPGAVPVNREARSAACYTLGAFIDEASTPGAAARLDALARTYHVRTVEERQASAYQVFLPPLRTATAAERKRRELARLGLRDLYVMQDGAKKNGISLGVFSTAKAAEEYQRKLSELGVAAQRHTLYKTQARTWLDLGRLDAALAQRLRQASWPEGVSIRALPCPPSVTGEGGTGDVRELP